ncbi:MAG TPA: hypothetical protein VMU77_00530 [Acidimicrobiales bacterium]|nr:hypothetical protein [Acidimicrobiales bacterium]
MASFTGPAQNGGIVGALLAVPPSVSQTALDNVSQYLGQPSPGMAARSLVSVSAPVPPTEGMAAPMPGETSSNGGAGSFGNASFMKATDNILGGASNEKGGMVNVLA